MVEKIITKVKIKENRENMALFTAYELGQVRNEFLGFDPDGRQESWVVENITVNHNTSVITITGSAMQTTEEAGMPIIEFFKEIKALEYETIYKYEYR